MLKRSFVLALLLPLAAGCHTVRPFQAAQLNANHSVQRVWVTRTDQTTVMFDQPELYGDTLTGMVYGEPQSIPLADAKLIRARTAAPGRTAALALVVSAAMLSGFLYMQSRPDVGGARYCGNAIGSRPAPYTSCCPAQDTVPC